MTKELRKHLLKSVLGPTLMHILEAAVAITVALGTITYAMKVLGMPLPADMTALVKMMAVSVLALGLPKLYRQLTGNDYVNER